MPSDSDSNQPESVDALQFETAEHAIDNPAITVPPRTCVVCHRPITSTYFAIRDKLLCPACCAMVKSPPKGPAAGRVFKAGLMGLGAGLVGAVIWFAIRVMSGFEIGLVAILVGFMVGKAVRKGSGNRGGRRYQILAVLLTYSCIAANYMPDVLVEKAQALHKHQSTTAPATTQNAASHSKMNPVKKAVLLVILIAILFGYALVAPFQVAATHNPIGLLIIGIGVWQAWKINTPLPITGPYQVGAAP